MYRTALPRFRRHFGPRHYEVAVTLNNLGCACTAQGKYARYYMALSNKELKKLPDAEKELNDLAGDSNKDLAALAKLALGGIYQESNRNDQAEKLFSKSQAKSTYFLNRKELEKHVTSKKELTF